MVSLWPWRGDGQSTATFEKTLSALSSKITKATNKQATLRTSCRRIKALWTLYAGFAYILFALIGLLVTGRGNWGLIEYIGIVASPILIYGIRYALHAYFAFRLAGTQASLDTLQKQREEVIEKFKNDTKYNSTQQLLEKYGAEPKSPVSAADTVTPGCRATSSSVSMAGDGFLARRTTMPPPATANIQRLQEDHSITPANTAAPADQPALAHWQSPRPIPDSAARDLEIEDNHEPQEQFAPNADLLSPQYIAPISSQPQWYDRIMDLLLGEDENRPVNRFALICVQCKLVNGQAPPGIKKLEDLGRWRCFSCRAWNGPDNEVQKILKETAADISDSSNHVEHQNPNDTIAKAGNMAAENDEPDHDSRLS